MVIRTVACVMSLVAIVSVPVRAQSTTQADPTDARGANLPTQTLGANDLIAISVYGSPELTRTVRVSAQGEIRLPMMKHAVRAEGLQPRALESVIAAALKADGLLVNPIVTVTVAEYASRPISIMGAVKRPLTFQAVGPMTLLDALARAEGLTADAGPEILVSRRETGDEARGTPVMRRISAKDLMGGADPEANITLHGGEEIRVPERGRVFVVGNVKRPGAFPVPDGGQMTVLQILAVSEGLLPYSSNQAYIYKQGLTTPENSVVIDLNQILERKAPDVALVSSDVLYIPANEKRKTTMGALGKSLAFITATISGMLIYGVLR